MQLTPYNNKTIISIFPTYPKSIPPFPDILFIIPSESAVVALPNTLGPATVNTTLNIAQTITANTPYL